MLPQQRRVGMLKNNVEVDVKVKCIEGDVTQAKLAEEIGTSAPYVSRLIRNNEKIVNKTFLQLMEKLGYDVELTYVKREEE
jgi:plasmid maintenance system antidote protein VapI